jgi:hypothetical protein
MDEKNETQDTQDLEETEAETTETAEDSDDPAILKARIKKLEEKAIAQRERTRLIKQEKAKLEAERSKKPDELDNADLAYLAAKGFEDDEEIAFIHKRMTKWDMSLRDVLKDEDVQEKLKSLKIEREVKLATPSSTKRGAGNAGENIDYWIAKYERTGELPANFELKSAVVNAYVAKANPNRPAWR